MLSDDEVQAFVKAQLRGGPLPRTPGEQEVQQILRALAGASMRECDGQAMAIRKKVHGARRLFAGSLLSLGLILIGFGLTD